MLEAVERRVLGAIDFVDAATGLPVRAPLQLRAAQLRLRRNGSGLWVVFGADGLEAHDVFAAPPAAPALGAHSYTVEVSDPAQRYLPRRFTLKLPRDPDPAHAAQADSLLRAQTVQLYGSPAAPLAPNWARLRLSLTRVGSGERIGGAFVRVTPALAGVATARGLSDAGGEALLAVPGIPKLMASGGGGGAVVTDRIDATLLIVVDPALAQFTAASELLAARLSALRGTVPSADPDDLEARAATLVRVEQPIQLASGAALHLDLQVLA